MARRRKTRTLGGSKAEHRRGFNDRLSYIESTIAQAYKADDCETRLHWYRDAWMHAGEAFTHLIGAGEGQTTGRASATDRRYNGALRKLDDLTADITKTCLRKPRKRRKR